MINGLLGKKVGMTQLLENDGTVIPVTVIKAGPCVVVQKKTKQKDGYDAVQLGFVEFVKPKRVNKPMTGHYKKSNVAPARFLREIAVQGEEGANPTYPGPIKEALTHQPVKKYLASPRSGTHKPKSRAEVQGSGKKPWRRKGTGSARVGEIRNPLWRKGGTVFGPRPRDYEYHLPKKMFRAALKSALALKLKENQLNVIEAFSLENHKTKPFAQALAKLGFDRKVLLVDHQENQNLWLA